MDPSLLREREKFQQRAKAQPVVEKKKTKATSEKSSKQPVKKVKLASKKTLDYKSAAPSSSTKFAVLAKIVSYMKKRHQEGETHSLNLEEILEETCQKDITITTQHWLNTEALPNNEKLKVFPAKDGEDTKYVYKPKLDIKNKKQLLKLLDRNDQKGLGGVLYDDVEEALPNAAKAVKALGDQIIEIVRPNDKKRVLFYNDKATDLEIEEDLKKFWRSCSVDGQDEGKIEEYLKKSGINSMQGLGFTKAAPVRRKGGKRKGQLGKTHNTHMEGILEDYSEKLNK